MALKALILRKKLTEKQNALSELERTASGFATREAELEADIEAAQTEEERAVVEEAANAFEAERSQNEADQETLRSEIAAMETEIREAEDKARESRSKAPGAERKDEVHMETRKFFHMTHQERDAFLAREDVKTFLSRARDLRGQKRAVSGAELAIPTVVLDLIRENIKDYSKLYKHVNVKNVPGRARQPVMGIIPPAIWTEVCAALSELAISFSAVEVDAYKVGGYVAVCNATLEDSDLALASELIAALGKSIGLGVDQAILYGTGTKMPMGIVTRLCQTEAPADAGIDTRPWVNLSATNVVAVSGKTDVALFKAIVEASGAAKGKYSQGVKFWAMNESTHATLTANALAVNAAGAIVSGINGTMPGIGGAIEELSFIPDGVIIGGYGDLYLLAERAGAAVGSSEHVKFIEDQTVFKGTARYDGLPVVAEGFVAIGISGTKPTANAVSFTT